MRVPSLKLLALSRLREASVLVLSLVCVSSCYATTSQHETFTNAVPFSSTGLSVPGLDKDKATLDNPASARELIRQMIAVQSINPQSGGPCALTDAGQQALQALTKEKPKKTSSVEKERQKAQELEQLTNHQCLPTPYGNVSDTYVLIHLLSWVPKDKNDTSPDSGPKVAADHWYVYRDVEDGKWSQEDFTSAKRILGAKRVCVLLLQFNAKNVSPTSESYIPDYDFTITRKTPANVTHVYQLLQAFASGSSAGGSAAPQAREQALEAPPIPDAVWSGGLLNIEYVPSDILIKSTFRVSKDAVDQNLGGDITFDNEGLYYWDVTFAVPVKKISQIQFDTTSGTATPADVSNTTVFAVFDGYLPPTDVKSGGFRLVPHPIAGVAFAKQPLSKILIGGAWGPKASELYMGALLVKQPILSGDTSCSNASGATETGKMHYCAQFTIGINISISSIASKLGARQ